MFKKKTNDIYTNIVNEKVFVYQSSSHGQNAG